MNKTYTVHCHMVVICTVTELICNISFGSTTSLHSLSMEICFFYYCQQIKFSLILKMYLDKSGIDFVFRPFCLFRAIHKEEFLVQI